MSRAQIEQFSSRVQNDSAMFNKLVEGAQSPDEFIDKAVALAAETGFTFTREEADGWIKSQIEAKADGELSDMQLEGVAGGKSLQRPEGFPPIGPIVGPGGPIVGPGVIGPWLFTW